MLSDKFRKLIDTTDLPLSSHEKESLANDLDKLVSEWLAKPERERDGYLANATERLAQRFKRRPYVVRVLGESSAPNKNEFASDVAIYFRRALVRIEKEAVRAGCRPPFTDAEHEHGFQIESIEQAEGLHRVVSHFHINGVPSRIVRRGILTAKRNGSFKVAEVRFEKTASEK